jgi:phosphate transport system permease protein
MRFSGEKGIQRLLLAMALSAIGGLLLIALFILKEGLPFILDIGVKNFLFAKKWDPQSGLFGIMPMIIASLWVTAGAMIVGAPLGVAGAVFLVEFVQRPVMQVKPTIELLAGTIRRNASSA